MKMILTVGRAQLWEGCKTKADPFCVMAHYQLNMSSYYDTVVERASVVQGCRRKQIFNIKMREVTAFFSLSVMWWVVQFCLVLTSYPQRVLKNQSLRAKLWEWLQDRKYVFIGKKMIKNSFEGDDCGTTWCAIRANRNRTTYLNIVEKHVVIYIS